MHAIPRLLLASFGFATAVAVFNSTIDPLQIFHSAWLTTARYSSNPRIGDAGLIRSQEFDTVFMGTSYSFHFRQGEIDEHLGGKSLKLAISGGTSKEQNVVLTAALKRHPKRVIWQMDDYMFRNSGEVDEYMPADLYPMNLKGVANYLFSLKTLRDSIWITGSSLVPIMQRFSRGLFALGLIEFDQTDASKINTFPSDVDPSTVFNAEHAKQAFELSLKSPSGISAGFDYASMVRNFEHDAAALIESNPSIPFVLYFPPSSVLHWVALRDVAPEALQDIYKFNEYQLERLSRVTNVAVYDFRDVEEITHNLANYRDTIHHSLEINRRILASIATSEHLVDSANPCASIKRLKHQVEEAAIARSGG